MRTTAVVNKDGIRSFVANALSGALAVGTMGAHRLLKMGSSVAHEIAGAGRQLGNMQDNIRTMSQAMACLTESVKEASHELTKECQKLLADYTGLAMQRFPDTHKKTAHIMNTFNRSTTFHYEQLAVIVEDGQRIEAIAETTDFVFVTAVVTTTSVTDQLIDVAAKARKWGVIKTEALKFGSVLGMMTAASFAAPGIVPTGMACYTAKRVIETGLKALFKRSFSQEAEQASGRVVFSLEFQKTRPAAYKYP